MTLFQLGPTPAITLGDVTTVPGKHAAYDVFISYATEDEESFVKPPALTLSNIGLKVWFAPFVVRGGLAEPHYR